jgi:hypothetical protein
MADILNEAYGILECKQCPWYKLCISPMRFSAEDIRRQMRAQAPLMDENQPDMDKQNLISSMAEAAQNQLLEGCPVFIERLRNDAELAKRIKEVVQNWHAEEQK